jgi:type VI secretion system protein VasD
MRVPLAGLRSALLVLTCVVVIGCGSSPPKPVKAHMTVAAAADVNPDASGRASPIVIRIYQLKDDAKYNNADFFALFDDDQKVLGADMLAREEVELAPGEQRQVDVAVAGEAKFVAALGAYRDIRNAQWRISQPAPKKGFKNIVKKDAVTIKAERAKVTLTVAD